MMPISPISDFPTATSVCCGYHHTIGLMRDGRAFGFGHNDHGQLGLGHAVQPTNLPRELHSLKDKRISSVAAGCYHTVFVGGKGTLYVCGRNNHGQLGTGDTTARHLPFAIASFAGQQVTQVAAGFYHTLVLTGKHPSRAHCKVQSSTSCLSTEQILPRLHLPTSNESETSKSHHKESQLPTLTDDTAMALFIVAHMDRLTFPAHVSADKVMEQMAIDNVNPTYIDVCAETFELTSILLELVSHRENELWMAKCHDPPGDQSSALQDTVLEYHFLIFALLRILRLNVLRLDLNLSEIKECPQRSTSDFWWRHSPRVYQNECLLMADKKQQQFEHASFAFNGHINILRSLRVLEVFLSQLVQRPFHRARSAIFIQQEAACALLNGFDLFYPSRSQQVGFLINMLQQLQMQAQTQQQLPSKGEIAQRFLLEKLLEKIARENLATYIIPVYNVTSSAHKTKIWFSFLSLLLQHSNGSTRKFPGEFEGGAETLPPLCKRVLLAMQKQLMVCAATAQIRCGAERRSCLKLNTCTAVEFSSESLIESASKQQTVEELKLSSCAECLAKYALILIESHLDLPDGRLADENTPREGHLRSSDSCRILLSLATGLIHFAYLPGLGIELIWPVAQLLTLVDSIDLGSIQAVQQEPASKLRASWLVGVEMSSLLNDLTKTLATLAGNLAASFFTDMDTQPLGYLHWLGSSLLRLGVEPRYHHMLARDATVPTEAITVNAVESQACDFRFEMTSDYNKRTCYGLYCAWLRSALCGIDRTYALVVRQIRSSTDEVTFINIEEMAASALLKHNNLTMQAEFYALTRFGQVSSEHNSSHVPGRFLAIWSVVARLTTWIWQQRSKSDSCEFESLLSRILASLHALMIFRSDSPCSVNLTYVPGFRQRKSRHTDATVCWRRAFVKVRVVVRWRMLYCTHTSILISPLMKSRQFPLRCKCEILNFVIELVNYKKSPDSNPVFSLLTRMAKEHYHLFLWRTGIKAYSTLMGSLQSHSSVSIILSTFHEILQRSNVFSGLKPQLSTIQTILSVDICIAARQSCEDFFRGLSNHLNCLDQSTGCATAVNPFSLRVDYARTVVMILNLWGTKHTEADWSYLSHAGVLPDLHKLFVKLYTSLTIKLPYKTHAFGLGSQVRARLDESNSILCDRSHLKTCLCATWALIRHFGASIGSANVIAGNTDLSCTDVPEQFLSVIYDLARRSLVRLNSDETRFTNYRSDQSGLEAQAGFHFDATQGRRCHELISAPMRFMNMEPGVVLSPGEVLSYPCGPDFSITCWLLLTQDSTGYYRSLFFRGLSRDSWPIVLLRDLDLRLEVGYLDENSGAFCKLITSKDACPLNAWIHIGLVCEGSKLRLYLDGSLDAQQINCEARPSTRYPLYVGRVPDGGFPIHGVRGGIEGSLANLRFYTRALSPIHVRVLCDQGAPEEFCFHDRLCNQICAAVFLLTSSDLFLKALQRYDWLNLLFNFYLFGTARVQQAVVRILRYLLPTISPTEVATLKERYDWLGKSAHKNVILDYETGGAKSNFLNYLLAIIGCSTWRLKPAYLHEGLLISSAAQEARLNLPSPRLLTRCFAQIEGRSNDYLSVKDLTDICTLSREMMCLIQLLSCAPKWQETTFKILISALSQARIFIETRPGESPVFLSRCLATLCTLGGDSGGIQRGSTIVLANSGTYATVIDCDEYSCSAQVITSEESNAFLPPQGYPDFFTKHSPCTSSDSMHLKRLALHSCSVSNIPGLVSVDFDQILVPLTSIDAWRAVTSRHNTSILTIVVPCVLNLLRLLSANDLAITHMRSSAASFLLDQLRSRSAKVLWMLTSCPTLCEFMTCQKMLMQTLLHACTQVSLLSCRYAQFERRTI